MTPVLITGAAGFTGFHLAKRLLERGDEVIVLDNLNAYYDVRLKLARLARLEKRLGFQFVKADLADQQAVSDLFGHYRPERVVNLAAQAGMRYSLTNPHAYANANLVGFLNVLKGCRHGEVEHLVYAASKKANELMAHSYAHLFAIPCTGLRFFTVHGSCDRPDLAYYKFTEVFDSKCAEPSTAATSG